MCLLGEVNSSPFLRKSDLACSRLYCIDLLSQQPCFLNYSYRLSCLKWPATQPDPAKAKAIKPFLNLKIRYKHPPKLLNKSAFRHIIKYPKFRSKIAVHTSYKHIKYTTEIIFISVFRHSPS